MGIDAMAHDGTRAEAAALIVPRVRASVLVIGPKLVDQGEGSSARVIIPKLVDQRSICSCLLACCHGPTPRSFGVVCEMLAEMPRPREKNERERGERLKFALLKT
jgi:hypothetical protein